MTDYCKIGPINIKNPHLIEGDNYKATEEEFEVYCTHWQYLQLLNLRDDGYSSQGSMGATILNGTNPWSPVYIDSSILITDNDYLKHRGWYIVTNVELSDIYLNKYLKTKLTVTKVTNFQNDYLTMDYTTGVYDGTQKDSTYDKTVTNTLLSDAFDTFDTVNNWTAAANDGLTGASIAASSGSLVFTGASSTNGVWKAEWTQTKKTYNPPYTLSTDLTMTSRPASGAKPHLLRLVLSPWNIAGQPLKDALCIEMCVSSTNTTFNMYYFTGAGAVTVLGYNYVLNATTYNISVNVYGDGVVSIYLNGSPFYAGPSNLSSVSNLKAGYTFFNQSSTIKSMSTSGISITQDIEQATNNIVCLPFGATTVINPDFTRTTSEGAVGCYVNPTVQLPFITSDPHLGTVKAYTSNNPDGISRQMLSTEEIPTPTTFYVSNGLVKLTTTTNGVTFSYWNGTGWATLNTFNIGTLHLLKLLDIGPQSVTFQANTTKWTLKAGKPYVIVKHPNDALTYTLKDTYDHDSTTTTSPASGADITMEDLSHAEIYNSTDTYRMQIYKLDPCTIKSDSIPASTETGIGVYNSSLDSSNYNSKDKLPLEYPLQTDQHISIKQV